MKNDILLSKLFSVDLSSQPRETMISKLRDIIVDHNDYFFRGNIATALAFAFYHHGIIGQRRDYTGEPYIVHPISVARVVANAGGDDEMIMAALLHDVAEDTHASLLDIFVYFGINVSRLVEMLTDVSHQFPNLPRAERKAMDLNHAKFMNSRAQTIKLADSLENTISIIKNNPGFAKIYIPEKIALLKELREGNPDLWEANLDVLSAFMPERCAGMRATIDIPRAFV